MFSKLIGQEKTKHYFSRVIDSGKIHHSFLFHGPEGTGKTAAALELAQILTCYDKHKRPCNECGGCTKFSKSEHPDILLFFPAQASIKMEEKQVMRENITTDPYQKTTRLKNAALHVEVAREIKRRLRLQSFLGHGRVIILLNCETMTLETANALLKLLEEPHEDVTFILTTSSLNDVLPTIRSRCQLMHFSYLSKKSIADALHTEKNISERKALDFAEFAGGSYSRALDFLGKEFEEHKALCNKIINYCVSEPLEKVIALSEELSLKENVSKIRPALEIVVSVLKFQYKTTFASSENLPAHNPVIDIPESLSFSNPEALISTIDEIEKSVDLLSKNVYLNLILVVLFFKMRILLHNE